MGTWTGGGPGVAGVGAELGTVCTCTPPPGIPGTGIVPGAGVPGFAGLAGCVGAGFSPLKTEVPPVPRIRFDRIASETEVSMKVMASPTVNLDKNVAVPRGPKAVWLPMPPNAPAKSAPRALCNKTPRINTTPTKT